MRSSNRWDPVAERSPQRRVRARRAGSHGAGGVRGPDPTGLASGCISIHDPPDAEMRASAAVGGRRS